MDFENMDNMKREGFIGFKKISTLQKNEREDTPTFQGVYFVLRDKKSPPDFLKKSIGGYFKRKDPTVTIAELKNNWVEGTMVIYIGKAGGSDSNATLRKRLKQYMQFGQGKPIGHWGGRLIWQVEGSSDFLVCWKVTKDYEPKEVEGKLIQEFKSKYGKLPFANLKE